MCYALIVIVFFCDVSGRGGGDGEGEVRSSRSARSGRRDDPRRHTLSGSDPHYPGGMSVQGGPLSRTMDLEVRQARHFFTFLFSSLLLFNSIIILRM